MLLVVFPLCVLNWCESFSVAQMGKFMTGRRLGRRVFPVRLMQIFHPWRRLANSLLGLANKLVCGAPSGQRFPPGLANKLVCGLYLDGPGANEFVPWRRLANNFNVNTFFRGADAKWL